MRVRSKLMWQSILKDSSVLLAVLGSDALFLVLAACLQYNALCSVPASCMLLAVLGSGVLFLVLAAFLQYNALCSVPASCMQLAVLGSGTLFLVLAAFLQYNRACIMHAACRAWHRHSFFVPAASQQCNALSSVLVCCESCVAHATCHV